MRTCLGVTCLLRDLPWRDLPSPRLIFVRDTVLSLPFEVDVLFLTLLCLVWKGEMVLAGGRPAGGWPSLDLQQQQQY